MPQGRYEAQNKLDKEGRQKSLKDFQFAFDRAKYGGKFEEDWRGHISDYQAMAQE